MQKGGIFSLNENTNFIGINSYFEENWSNEGGVMFAYDNLNSQILFQNCIFKNNSAESFLFSLLNSQINMINVSFTSNFNNLFLLTNSNLTFENSSIKNHVCSNIEYGCLAKGVQNSYIYLKQIQVFDLGNSLQGGNIYIEDSSLNVYNSNFTNMTSQTYVGVCVYGFNALTVNINGSNFINFDYNCILIDNGNISINNSLFSNEKKGEKINIKINYGCIRCFLCQNFNIMNSVFLKNDFVKYGGAITLDSFISNTGKCIIYLNKFLSNVVSENGGAILIYNSICNILECIFDSNSAKNGAAIYNDNKLPLATLIIKNNTFINNFASKEGGAVKWTNIMPNITDNIFTNNQAFYGNDVASFPIRLQVFINFTNFSTSFDEIGISKIPFIRNISSGNTLPFNITVLVLDCYDQIVSTIDSYKFCIFYLFINYLLNFISEKFIWNFLIQSFLKI